MRQAPLLYILLPFAAGIVAALSFSIPLVPALLLSAAALAWLALTAFVPSLQRLPHGLFQTALALFFLGAGVALTQLRDPVADGQHYVHHTTADSGYDMRLRLVETPMERRRSVRVTAEVEAIASPGDTLRTQGRVLLYLRKDSLSASLRYGDRLQAHGRLTLPQGADNPYQFDYRRYLRRKGVARQCWLDSGNYRLTEHVGGGLVGWSKELQWRLVQRLRSSGLSPAQCGIAEALLLGWRSDLDEATQAQFRDAGILHLLCVSGLHVGIVAALIGWLCLPLRRQRRWVSALLQLTGIWLFVLITGMAPATLRAAVMFSLLVLAQMTDRRPNGYNTLAAAALLMIVVRPTLVTDIGFQLSFAAVLGIVMLYRPLCRLLPSPLDKPRRGWRGGVRKAAWRVWQLACLSTAAQLGTLPISIYHFHQFPTYFLIANLTVVPAAGLLVGTTLLLVLTTPLPVLAQGIVWLLGQELSVAEAVTRWVQTLPGARWDHIYCDGVVVALLVALVAALALLLHRRDKRWLPIPMLCLVALAGYGLHIERAADTQQRWIVYDMPRHTAIEFFSGHSSVLLVDDALLADSARMDYVSDNLLTRLRIRHRITLPRDVNIESPFLQVRNDTIHFYGHYIQPDDAPHGQLVSF